MNSIPRINNFDLIRIIAALQVVYGHLRSHLQIENEVIQTIFNSFLFFFPGVPIFYFVSGFLIYWSFDRNHKSLKKFYWHRLVRIYPALWACLLVTILLLCLDFSGALSELLITVPFLQWIAAQVSFFQFYTPDVLRFWGVGAPNGSLWTISVELQFYLLVPFLYYLFRASGKKWLLVSLLLFFLSIAFNIWMGQVPKTMMLRKLGGVFIFSYLYYFLIGIMAFKLWPLIFSFFENRFLQWTTIYLLFIIVFGIFGGYDLASYWILSFINLISSILLACWTLSFAFSYKNLSKKLLKGNDISYGIYIYHALVLNYFVHHGLLGSTSYFFSAFSITIMLGWLSWVLVERKSLRWKHLVKN